MKGLPMSVTFAEVENMNTFYSQIHMGLLGFKKPLTVCFSEEVLLA